MKPLQVLALLSFLVGTVWALTRSESTVRSPRVLVFSAGISCSKILSALHLVPLDSKISHGGSVTVHVMLQVGNLPSGSEFNSLEARAHLPLHFFPQSVKMRVNKMTRRTRPMIAFIFMFSHHIFRRSCRPVL